jgi:gamma-glutamyltranspeptidase / glutathione hydrolase
MSFGVMGGHMQPQGHLQVLLRVRGYRQNPQSALDAPRWQVLEDFRIALERGWPVSVIEALTALGHQVVPDQPEKLFGGGQIIHRLTDGYCAASDPRKDGMAGGY